MEKTQNKGKFISFFGKKCRNESSQQLTTKSFDEYLSADASSKLGCNHHLDGVITKESYILRWLKVQRIAKKLVFPLYEVK